MATGTGNLPNPGMTFDPFDPLTAEEMTNLVENIESLATGAGIGDGAIGPDDLDITTTYYYNEITTAFSTASTSDVAVTGLTVTFTVPTGGRNYVVDFDSPSVYNSSTNYNTVKIWDGTVGSGTLLRVVATYGNNGTAIPCYMRRKVTLSAGSHTINVSLNANAGTANVNANNTGSPTSISVRLVP